MYFVPTNNNKLIIYIYRTATLNVGNPQINGSAINDPEIANQVVIIKNGSYSESFKISFRVVDGKRTMTIRNGEQSVTWVEMTVAE